MHILQNKVFVCHKIKIYLQFVIMTLLDIFTPSILISLGISLLLIGVLGMYFMGKCITQDHKIASMFGLVSSMAEEMHFMREKIQSVKFNTGVTDHNINNNHPPLNPAFPFIKEENTLSFHSGSTELITVSDGESDSNDESSDSGSSENSEDDDNDDVSSVDSDDNVEDIDMVQSLEDDKSNIKIINVGDTFNMKFDEIDNDVIELDLKPVENSEMGNNDTLSDDDDDSSDDESLSSNNEVPDIDISNSNSTIESTLLHDSADMLKSINMSISNLDHSSNDIDYKKMSLNKLKQVVVDKKLVANNSIASKLKKPELLKLLNIDM